MNTIYGYAGPFQERAQHTRRLYEFTNLQFDSSKGAKHPSSQFTSQTPATLTTDLISKKMHVFIAVLYAAVIREKSERTNEIT